MSDLGYEAWAKRRYDKHFLSKLTDEDGEQCETQHWIGTALECEYLSLEQAKALMDNCMEIGRMLGGMMSKPELFCGEPYKTARESSPEYFVSSADNFDY
jgi:hypothetical protein